MSYGANLPSSIQHRADSHPLHLFNAAASSRRAFCNACAGNIETGFSYRCVPCDQGLHTDCAFMPPSMHLYAEHDHPLVLVFAPPYPSKTFICDLCKGGGGNHWLYHCCNFDAHLRCCNFDAHLHCASARQQQQQQRQIQTRSPPTVGTTGVGISTGGYGAPATSFPQVVNPAPSLQGAGLSQGGYAAPATSFPQVVNPAPSQGAGAWTNNLVNSTVTGLSSGLGQQIGLGLVHEAFAGDGGGEGDGEEDEEEDEEDEE